MVPPEAKLAPKRHTRIGKRVLSSHEVLHRKRVVLIPHKPAQTWQALCSKVHTYVQALAHSERNVDLHYTILVQCRLDVALIIGRVVVLPGFRLGALFVALLLVLLGVLLLSNNLFFLLLHVFLCLYRILLLRFFLHENFLIRVFLHENFLLRVFLHENFLLKVFLHENFLLRVFLLRVILLRVFLLRVFVWLF